MSDVNQTRRQQRTEEEEEGGVVHTNNPIKGGLKASRGSTREGGHLTALYT